MRLVKLQDRVYVELHVDCPEGEVRRVLTLMSQLGYDVVALVNKDVNYVVKLNEELDKPLVLSKLYVRGREIRKVEKYFHRYDIIATSPEDRFVLNKLIRLPEVDVITVNPENVDALPTKDQLKIMAEEGKALEILLRNVTLSNYKLLKSLDIFLNEALNIEELPIFFSIGITSIYDVKNPRDVIAFLKVLTERSDDVFRVMRERWLTFLTDVYYRRGVPSLTYF